MKTFAPRVSWLMPLAILACGVSIALWPRARAMAMESWLGTSSMPAWDNGTYRLEPVLDEKQVRMRVWTKAKKEFPNDADVQILASENLAPSQALSLLEKRLQRTPKDLFWLSYYAHVATYTLQPDYGSGPVQNPNWPAKSNISGFASRGTPAQWRQLERFALRGAALDPDNGFWMWMRVRALVGLKRENEIGAVFRGATGTTRFEAYNHEHARWREATTRRALPPLLPRYRMQGNVASWWFYHAARDSAMRGTEQVMIARAANRHDEAISTALAIIHSARLLRLGSDSFTGIWTGLNMETQMFNSAQLPPRNPPNRARRAYVRPGFPFSTFTTTTPLVKPAGNLPLYLQQQGRRVELVRLAREWATLAPYNRAARSYPWIDEQIPAQIARLHALERGCRLATALLVPVTAWGVSAMLGAWIWRRHAPARNALSWPMCWGAATFLVLSVGALDASWWWQNPDIQPAIKLALINVGERLTANYGLISHAPLALWAWPLVLLSLFALRAATKQQLAPPQTSVRDRFREVLSLADELAAFDLSPLIGIFTSLVAWFTVIGVLLWAGYNWPPRSSVDFNQIGATGGFWSVIFAVVVGGLFVVRWSRRPHKRVALAAWFRMQIRLIVAFLGVLVALFLVGHVLTIPDDRAFERAFEREISGQTFREWRASKKLN
jgi:hypothetical protein